MKDLKSYIRYFTCFLLTLLFFGKTYSQSYFPAGLAKNQFNLWFDAADTTTFTKSNDSISAWKDKANNLSAAQIIKSKMPFLSTHNGYNIVDFKGLQGLDIADTALLNPINGYFLAQTIYLFPDAPITVNDFRDGTYSRGQSNANTPSLSIRYIAADSVYRLGMMQNSSGTVLGLGNKTIPDLRGTSNLIEEYLPSAIGAATLALNANLSISKSGDTSKIYTNVASLGNRSGNYANVHWGINETILTGAPLATSARELVDLYLAWKWHTTQYIPAALLALYTPTDTTFNNSILGIGNNGGTDTVLSTKSDNGLGIANANLTTGFGVGTGNYLVAGDNNSNGLNTNLGNGFSAWKRAWYISKTDAAGIGGGVNLSFDFNATGNVVPDTGANSLYLLYNATDGSFKTGRNNIVPVSTSFLSNATTYTFTLDANNIFNGFYTLLYAPKGTSLDSLVNYAPFIPPTLTIASPILQSVIAGNSNAVLQWTTTNLSYTPASYLVFKGTSADSLQIVDTVYGASSLTYVSYNLVNGTTYYFGVKAITASGLISDSFNNIIAATPYIDTAIWNFTPQYSGNNTVTMSALAPDSNQYIRYNFQRIANGDTTNNGWQSSTIFTDTGLQTGVVYAYRFQFEDSTHTSTLSDWSTLDSVTTQSDSLQGGYTYKWATYNHSDNNYYGLGPDTVTFDTTGMQFVKHAPPIGVHPRVFCNPEDSTAIKWRLQNTASGKAIAAKIHAFTVLLQLGSKAYNQKASYAVDSLGKPYIGLPFESANEIKSNQQAGYDSLIAQKHSSVKFITSSGTDLSVYVACEAFECWLFKGTIDTVTNTSYDTRAQNLGKAMYYWAYLILNDTATGINLGENMGLIYDFAYPLIADSVRNEYRAAMAKTQAHAWVYAGGSDYYGLNWTSFACTSNWSTWGNQTLNDIAMEGEPGANTTRTITYARTQWNFLTYGVYPTGQPYEGLGKNELDVRVLYVLARRGLSLLAHPHVRAFAHNYLPAITQPFGFAFVGTDLLGGFDYDGSGNNATTPAYGNWRFHAVDMVPLKWMFPKDTAVDFVWKNYIKQFASDQKANDGYYGYQNMAGTSPFWPDLFAAIYPADYLTIPFAQQAQAAHENNDTYFDSLGGFVSMRSGFDTSALTLWFHNRQDLGGHSYGNKNDIMLSALGRAWFPKVGTDANSNAPWSDQTDASTCVLINGQGASGSGGIRLPGRIVYFNDSSAMSAVAGDATTAYNWAWKNYAVGYPAITETRNSFQYKPVNKSYFNITFSNYPFWDGPNQLNNWVKEPFDTLQKVLRTVSLVKDSLPYVLVADDVQKNNSINNYKWLAQLATDLVKDSVVVDTSNGYYRNDFILKETCTNGNRRLLVRVLNNIGAASFPARIDSLLRDTGVTAKSTYSPRLVIESNSIAPQFKIMIFPFVQGTPLPVTIWNPTHDTLTIMNNGTNKYVNFVMDSTGRTNINLVTAPATLPVALTFSGSLVNNTAQLTWEGRNETNLKDYVIEKSSDGINYVTLGIVAAENKSEAKYSFVDNNLIEGNNYYRLKAINKDGSYSYSNVVKLTTYHSPLTTIAVYPNPIINNQVMLQTNNLPQGKYTLLLIDNLGREVMNSTINITNGSQSQQITIPDTLPKGVYRVILEGESNKYEVSLVK
jgi:hypothetical protein